MALNKVLAKSIDILEYASLKPDGFRIADIVRDLDIPKATAFNLIYTLVDKEMLRVSNNKNKLFYLGSKSYSIGIKFMDFNSIQNVVALELEELGKELSTTVFMGTLDNNKVLYLFKYTPSVAVLDPCTIGTKADVYCTALGKCLIAFKDDFDFNTIVFKKHTEKTLTSIEALKENLVQVRKNGYSIDDQEIRESVVCIAAPIYNKQGDVVYAVSASALYESNFDMNKKVELIKKAAKNISDKL